MSRARPWLRGAAFSVGGLVAALTVAVGINTALRVTGDGLPRVSPVTRAALLAPHVDLRLPPGPGPHPALALFSGCDGVRDNMDRWADLAVSMGIAALVVDSHTPRKFDTLELWRLVCAGQLLAGPERAGDVAVALSALRADPRIDPDRLAILGASHGGWAVLDFLALSRTGRRPDGLSDWPEGSGARALSGVRGAFVLYPYCGVASRAARDGWPDDMPVAMVLVAGDTITGDGPCRDLAARMADQGAAPQVRVMEGVTHGFDQRERAALSPLAFDSAATEETAALLRAWLERRLVPQRHSEG